MQVLNKNFSLPQYWQRPIITLTSVLVLLLLSYHHTVISVTSIWWHSETYAHGILIIPFTLYMIWTRRQQLAQLQPTFSWWGLALLLPAIFVWLLGTAVDVLAIEQLALLGMIWAMILAVLGRSATKCILFPLIFLIFLVPMGEGLIPILMDFTAAFTVKALLLSGFPVYWEGMSFAIPSGSFEVAKACSGVRYLFASVALGSLFAYINFTSFKKRSLFILVSILLPIVANGLRAYGIVLIAHYSNMKYAVGFDHLIYGWLFFGLIMFLLFYFGNKWRDTEIITTSIKQNVLTNVDAVGLTKPLLMLLLAMAGPMATTWMQTGHVNTGMTVLSAPHGNNQWRQIEKQPQQTWKIDFKGVDHEVKAAYSKPPQVVRLYIGFYATESQDAELINQVNSLDDIKHWTEVQHEARIVVVNNKKIRLHGMVLRSGDQERMIWYWYDLNGFTTANFYIGKLMQSWQRLTGRDHGNAIIALLTTVLSDRKAASEQLQDFLNAMYPAIQLSLAKMRKVR